MKKATRSLLFAVVASTVLLPVFASQHEPIRERKAVQIRALLATQPVVSSAEPTTAAAPTSEATTSAAAATSPTTTNAATSAAPTSAAATSAGTSAATSHETSAAASSTQPVVTSAVATTDAAGSVFTSVLQFTQTTPSATPSQTSSSDSSTSSGLSTGSIIGLSVAGGIAAIGIILFFVWKFTRKRFADFDDNEAIKWPELNAHNSDVHALPTNSTGRAGFGPENDSDINLTRAPSPGGTYAGSIGASSVPDMYGTRDPYAVPPLPHLNPNQPYHDDPGAYGQPASYYDPYRGPVPNTFTDAVSDGHGAEAIPMTQMARVRSPAPQVAYDMQGRGSPAPQAVMGYAGVEGRSATPTPAATLSTGRASPSPHPGYGYGPR